MKLHELPCYCASLRQAARAITSIYEEAFAGTGVYSTQYTILQVLMTAQPVGTTDLAGLLGIDQTTATRMLALIKRDGLIEVRPDVDRRRRTWGLTRDGVMALKQLKPVWDKAQATIENRLGTAQAMALKNASYASALQLQAAP